MKIITCTGYGATGSSVVSDLLKEFKKVKSYGDFEFRFIQDPHGLRDLEYGLFENNNRTNTDYYIKQFMKHSKFLSKSLVYKYEDHFNGNFKKLSDEFINNIIDVSYDGFWHQDIIDETPIRKFSYYLERFIQKKILKLKDVGAKYYKNKMYYAKPISKQKFYEEVKNYTDQLIQNMNFDKDCDFVVLDQLVPPDHNETYLNYFSNLKVIVVDRDPRDVFLLEKYKYRDAFTPFDVETFCKWYPLVRKHQSEEVNSENVLFVRFEDFIYKYEETIKKVINFLGIPEENWIKKGEFFKPEISIKNTKQWLSYPDKKDEISVIERELKDYLYPYEK